MARLNLNDVRDYGKRALNRAYIGSTRVLGCERIVPQAVTHRYSIYEDVVRKSQELFKVCIYYDKFSPSQGLYIVGRKSCAEECGRWLIMIMMRVEKDAYEFGKNSKTKVHGNEAISNHAHKKVRQILGVQNSLIKTMYDLYYDSTIAADYFLVDSWADQLGVLKNKTKYHGELRNSGGNDGPPKKSV